MAFDPVTFAVIVGGGFGTYKVIRKLFEKFKKDPQEIKEPEETQSENPIPKLVDEPSKRGSYYFIGPPKSGKTVFFVVMADIMQRMHIENGDKAPYTATYTTNKSKRFVSDCIRMMQKSEWPTKTQSGNTYEMDIESRKIIAMREARFVFHDYAGEVFMRAFADPAKQEESSTYAEDANKMREEMKNAKGVFLILDSAVLHNGLPEDIQDRLFYLADYMKNANASIKMAVIFSKKDMFNTNPIEPEKIFKDKEPDTFLKFQKLDTKYFFVTSVKNPEIEGGTYVPPKNYKTSQSEGIIDAALWMLDIKDKPLIQELKEIIENKIR
ncbi:MAG: hypothetical protein BWX92_03243 [Deltaproteobacteria bacterium ADurb.Bin135]|jgi:hypothetical protein|nr:MAG: hypothetical protein BWX92_03243 [Deltaproteobacteria bacterium ADurb.Bin135]HOS45793.1 hypothetical protein [Paludibacter sp.]HPM10230.1 hypothetical protein [Paludibacter sp.]